MSSESHIPEPLGRLIGLLAPAVTQALEADPTLREEVRHSLEAWLASPLFTRSSPAPVAAGEPAAVPPVPSASGAAPASTVEPDDGRAARETGSLSLDPAYLQSLIQGAQLGGTQRIVPFVAPVRPAYKGPRLKELGRRFLLKASACRRILDVLLAPDVPAGPIELRDLLAKAAGTNLWMHGASHHAASAAEWLETAEAFDLTGRAVTAASEAGDPGTGPAGQAWLQLMASAQCVLRNAISRNHRLTDDDQVFLHGFLKAAAFEHQFLLRHLRLKDVLTAAELPRLESALQGLMADAAPRSRSGPSPVRERARRLQYHAKRLGEIPPEGDAAEAAHHIDVIAEAVRALEAEGVEPTDDAFLPLVPLDQASWDGSESGVVIADLLRRRTDVLAAAAEAVEEEPSDSGEETAGSPPRMTPEMERIRKRLEGRTVLLIGGDPQPRRIEAYLRAFGLASVEWPETRHHQSNERLATLIERPDVAVVAVAIRWASHSRSELRQVVQRAGKPWVVLERGLNPAQFASALLEQCSEHPALAGG